MFLVNIFSKIIFNLCLKIDDFLNLFYIMKILCNYRKPVFLWLIEFQMQLSETPFPLTATDDRYASLRLPVACSPPVAMHQSLLPGRPC